MKGSDDRSSFSVTLDVEFADVATIDYLRLPPEIGVRTAAGTIYLVGEGRGAVAAARSLATKLNAAADVIEVRLTPAPVPDAHDPLSVDGTTRLSQVLGAKADARA